MICIPKSFFVEKLNQMQIFCILIDNTKYLCVCVCVCATCFDVKAKAKRHSIRHSCTNRKVQKATTEANVNLIFTLNIVTRLLLVLIAFYIISCHSVNPLTQQILCHGRSQDNKY